MKEKIKHDDRNKETYIAPVLNRVIIEMEQGIAAGSGSNGGSGDPGGDPGGEGGWGSL